MFLPCKRGNLCQIFLAHSLTPPRPPRTQAVPSLLLHRPTRRLRFMMAPPVQLCLSRLWWLGRCLGRSILPWMRSVTSRSRFKAMSDLTTRQRGGVRSLGGLPRTGSVRTRPRFKARGGTTVSQKGGVSSRLILLWTCSVMNLSCFKARSRSATNQRRNGPSCFAPPLNNAVCQVKRFTTH